MYFCREPLLPFVHVSCVCVFADNFNFSLSLSTCLACIDKIKAATVSPIFYVSCICEKSLVPCIPSPEAVVELLLFLIQDLQNKVRKINTSPHNQPLHPKLIPFFDQSSLSKEGDKLKLKAKYSFDTGIYLLSCSQS